jgi:hypothetical protein
VTSLDWVTYPVLRFKDHPKVTPTLLQPSDRGPHERGEEPITAVFAAIANAFFDATGVRLRQGADDPGRRPHGARGSVHHVIGLGSSTKPFQDSSVPRWSDHVQR